ncbi:hypothetical protein K458DRAFT_97669 [Lentithecium fluviatile CBS 122367]|uniref:Uncharacterized protein n=1 Tax=Lentithecium fluviatile CBS 122367 TaxID=1168545 RepID=A0A6G1JIK7_9PLEO|nr:hypothetical protein K458DRAFT_97669 [Lentithecium fluviatile CBS 122367]
MAFRSQPVPSHWNAYRPSNEPLHRDADITPRSADMDRVSYRPTNRPQRRAPDRRSPMPTALDRDNPNNIPIARREPRPTVTARRGPVHSDLGDGLPKLWSADLDDLMGMTSRAYEVVCEYEKKSMGGKRWTRENIDRIYEAGRHLDSNIHALKNLRQEILKSGITNRHMQAELDESVTSIQKYCTYIQDLIKEFEKVPENQKKKANDDEMSSSPGMRIKGMAGGQHRDQVMEEDDGSASGPQTRTRLDATPNKV